MSWFMVLVLVIVNLLSIVEGNRSGLFGGGFGGLGPFGGGDLGGLGPFGCGGFGRVGPFRGAGPFGGGGWVSQSTVPTPV